MDEQSLVVRQGWHTTNRIQQQMAPNRPSNQSQGKANGKNRPNKQRRQGARVAKEMQKGDKSTGDAPLSKASNRRNPRVVREKQNSDGSRTIYFEEYVQDINGSVAFSATSFPVQPGLPTLFAWLASQAISYQEYSVESLAFRLESDREATAPGKLMVVFQQDPSDALPASKQEMLENEYKAKCKTWENCRLNVPQQCLKKDALSKTRFIRTGALAANLDIKMYDIGQVIVATQGQADATGVCEFYVEYGITLKTPIISSAAMATSLSATVTGATAITKSAQFGTASTVTGGLAVTAASQTLTFNRVGKYSVFLNTVGTGLFTVFSPTLTGTATSSVASGISNAAANAGTSALVMILVTVTSRGQTVIIDMSAHATTVTACSGFVAQFATP